MTNDVDLKVVEECRTATLRRIGRNLVNVQRIEEMAKFLIKLNFSSPLKGSDGRLRKHAKRVSRKTLGNLISMLAGNVLQEVGTARSAQDLNKVWLTTSFRLPLDPEALAAWNSEWAKILKERNRLVHLMLAHVDFGSVGQCNKLDIELDAQNDLFLAGIDFLRPVVVAAKEEISKIVSGEVQFEPPLPGDDTT
jgi:hypothetical protein